MYSNTIWAYANNGDLAKAKQGAPPMLASPVLVGAPGSAAWQSDPNVQGTTVAITWAPADPDPDASSTQYWLRVYDGLALIRTIQLWGGGAGCPYTKEVQLAKGGLECNSTFCCSRLPTTELPPCKTRVQAVGWLRSWPPTFMAGARSRSRRLSQSVSGRGSWRW